MPTTRNELLPGTLDMLILKTLANGPNHGYGVARRIRAVSQDVLSVEEGSLYPALHRLEKAGAIEAEWRASESNRRAKYYKLTAGGRRMLRREVGQWERVAGAIGKVIGASRTAARHVALRSRALAGPLAVMAMIFINVAATAGENSDSDGDGLSDFQERHKYFTDPSRADSDGDGTADGDWNERREYAYSIRTLVRVMPPVTETTLSNDYQDARMNDRREGCLELEIIHYPLNTVAQSMTAGASWRDEAAPFDEFVRPGVTANWDEAMQRDMRAALKAANIDVAALTDRDVVEKVSRWLMSRVRSINSSAYVIRFTNGRPEVLPEALDEFRSIMIVPGGSVEDQFQRELYGRGMYEHRMTGSCTPAATYLATGLRAMGIPTRIVRAIPMVDASDPQQVELVRRGITHHDVQRQILVALERMGRSFTAHTFNEVHVGGRWRTLNYDRLGQNSLDENLLGQMTFVQTYNDFSECGVADTWGVWLQRAAPAEPFPFGNPYRALEISDLFGTHSSIENLPLPQPGERREHQRLTITKIYWTGGPDAPDFVRGAKLGERMLGARVAEWFPEERDGDQLKRFTQRADLAFVLKAPGQPDVAANAMLGCVSSADGAMREILIAIDESAYPTMKPGAAYTLHPRNGKAGASWAVNEGVSLMRPGAPP